MANSDEEFRQSSGKPEEETRGDAGVLFCS